MEEERQKVKLKELFTDNEIIKIGNYLENDNWVKLRMFLNTKQIKHKLKVKGVHSDYLYYWFEYSFKGGE